MRKLRNKAGETLAEVLCAVLVTGLAVALLAGMMDASVSLDQKTARTVSELYSSVAKAEDPGSTVSTYPTEETGTVPVEVEGEAVNLEVTFYGHKDQVTGYRATEPPESSEPEASTS